MLVSHLEVAFEKWRQMNFTIPQKSHSLMSRAAQMIRLRKGLAHVGISRIDRAHQLKHKDDDSSKRLSNVDKRKQLKLKRQAIRNDFEIKTVVNKASDESKRKRKGEVIEHKTSKDKKPFLGNFKREKILLEVQNETKSFECKHAIAVKIEQKENQLEEETKDENFKGVIAKATCV